MAGAVPDKPREGAAGSADLIPFERIVELVRSGGAQAVRAARARPAAVYAAAAVSGWAVSPLIFPTLLLLVSTPLVLAAFGAARPRLAAALQPLLQLAALLVVTSVAFSSLPEAEAEAAPKLLPLLGLALGALLPTVLAVRLFVQLADAMSAVGPAAPPSSSAPPSGQEKESFGAFCLLVHLLGERPASLRGPDARALQWLLEGELEVCQ